MSNEYDGLNIVVNVVVDRLDVTVTVLHCNSGYDVGSTGDGLDFNVFFLKDHGATVSISVSKERNWQICFFILGQPHHHTFENIEDRDLFLELLRKRLKIANGDRSKF